MATQATLSELHELHGRLHDLSVVALRTRGRQRDLVAALPGPSSWAGPAAVAYTAHRLTLRAAALGVLADALDAVAGQLGGVVRASPPTVCVDSSSSAVAVRQAQRLLAAAGVSPGPTDGVWGASSMAAVMRVQTRAGLPATGVIDYATALALSAAAAGGAVAVGGAPGVPGGLHPLAGSHPVVAAAPPAADPAPTVAPDPADGQPADPTGDADPTDSAGTPDDGTGDLGDAGNDEGADPGPASPAGVSDLLRRLSPPPSLPATL